MKASRRNPHPNFPQRSPARPKTKRQTTAGQKTLFVSLRFSCKFPYRLYIQASEENFLTARTRAFLSSAAETEKLSSQKAPNSRSRAVLKPSVNAPAAASNESSFPSKAFMSITRSFTSSISFPFICPSYHHSCIHIPAIAEDSLCPPHILVAVQ